MELFFESRPEIAEDTTGKVQFFKRKPQIHPEPVLEPDSFVDEAGVSLYGTVLNDGGRLRMWYQAWPRNWRGGNADYVGYAESDDVIEWEKPKLGLVDFGGADNNLVDLNGHRRPSSSIRPRRPTIGTGAPSAQAPSTRAHRRILPSTASTPLTLPTDSTGSTTGTDRAGRGLLNFRDFPPFTSPAHPHIAAHSCETSSSGGQTCIPFPSKQPIIVALYSVCENTKLPMRLTATNPAFLH
jgi:hypothetical protein